jgi:hypothetical protein
MEKKMEKKMAIPAMKPVVEAVAMDIGIEHGNKSAYLACEQYGETVAESCFESQRELWVSHAHLRGGYKAGGRANGWSGV